MAMGCRLGRGVRASRFPAFSSYLATTDAARRAPGLATAGVPLVPPPAAAAITARPRSCAQTAVSAPQSLHQPGGSHAQVQRLRQLRRRIARLGRCAQPPPPARQPAIEHQQPWLRTPSPQQPADPSQHAGRCQNHQPPDPPAHDLILRKVRRSACICASPSSPAASCGAGWPGAVGRSDGASDTRSAQRAPADLWKVDLWPAITRSAQSPQRHARWDHTRHCCSPLPAGLEGPGCEPSPPWRWHA